ncbi:outer membrane lipoprotein carrier protein LolA [Methylovorus sp. MM2]|uniref:outer membrane lipoprotein chaperone LolA n=1 Tax=Methylovorus sp. MM2 TaxID=1848038 RepID=UPI0007DFFAF3|nr:outer membrane lipoprotein chaperone LolA [Methylovorus sp. MM2]OAM52761.1 outer membrane lipoprotein carrier protein LolA [Methylovorus sp. MM2]
MKQLFIIILAIPTLAFAGGMDRLKAFYQNTTSMRANFNQTVVDSQGRKVQEVTGTMQLQRPGKFRWDYNKPYVQQIVGDGEKVWLYDPDLNQVTVRPLSKTLGSSPASLLAGSKDMEKSFTIKDEGRQDDLDWVQATPKDADSGFERVYLGFKEDALQQMELHDSFGHITVIEFTKLERNQKPNAQAFRFTVPAGADVVGE